MRIGLIGWYGHDNAGDERILHCLRRFLAGHELLVTGGFHEARQALDQLNGCDYVLLGGGGLILRGFGCFASLIQRLRTPFACVGISVEAVHQDNLQLIEAIKKKAEFILVRDAESARLIGQHPALIVGPDLTFFDPFEPAPVASDETCGINLRAWHYWCFEYGGAAHELVGRLDRRFPWFKRIYPLARWEPGRALAAIAAQFPSLLPLPLYFEPGALTDAQLLQQFLPAVPTTFDPDHLARCRYLLAMRLHALIFACQMGIPFISLSYQPKNAAFCQALGLADCSIPLWDYAALAQALTRLRRDHAALRQKLLDFRQQAHQTLAQILRDLAGRMSLTPPVSPEPLVPGIHS